MNNKRVRTKAMAMAVDAAMAVELCPVTAFAVTGDQVAADGTYTSTAQVNRTAQDDEDENGWDPYGISVSLTVKDGKFEDITVTPDSSYSEKDNKSYFDKAYSKSKGIKTKLEGQPATEDTIKNWDAVSTATRTSTAVKQAALEAMQSASEKQDPTPVEVNTAALQTSITTAEGKNQADYTEASWAALTEKLTAAKAALEAKESQETVDAAQTALDAAVAALEAKPSEPEKPDVTTGTYVLMNIPYDQFYAADVNNSVKVDAFTSATKNKVRTAGLAGGSYHVDASGDEITGVTFPVKVGEGVVKIAGAVALVAGSGGAALPVATCLALSAGNDVYNAMMDATYTYTGDFNKIGNTNLLKEFLVKQGRETGEALFGDKKLGETMGNWIYTGLDIVSFLNGVDQLGKSFGKFQTAITGTAGTSKVWGEIHMKDVIENTHKLYKKDGIIKTVLRIDPTSVGNFGYDVVTGAMKAIQSAGKLGSTIADLAFG